MPNKSTKCLPPITNAPPLKDLLAEIEEDLYAALQGFEDDDLILVRQCAARVQTNTIVAWKQQRREHQE